MNQSSAKDGKSLDRTIVGLFGTPGQGQHMVIVLYVKGNSIVDARFSTYGCPAAHACGEWLTTKVEKMSFDEAAAITTDDLLRGTGRMPLGREHCPWLAINALRDALSKMEATDNKASESSGREAG